MEASPNPATQPTSAGYQRAERPPMGALTQGILAHRRLLGPLLRPAQRLLGRPRPARVRRTLPPFPGMLSEPPDADPHVRWCGGRRGEPGAYPIVGGVRIRLCGAGGGRVQSPESVAQSGSGPCLVGAGGLRYGECHVPGIHSPSRPSGETAGGPLNVVTRCPDLTDRLLRADSLLKTGENPDPYIAYALAALSAYA